MPKHSAGRACVRIFRGSAKAAGALTLLLLVSTSGFPGPGPEAREAGLKLALVDSDPGPGAVRLPLDKKVAEMRRSYSRLLPRRFRLHGPS